MLKEDRDGRRSRSPRRSASENGAVNCEREYSAFCRQVGFLKPGLLVGWFGELQIAVMVSCMGTENSCMAYVRTVWREFRDACCRVLSAAAFFGPSVYFNTLLE